MTPDYVGPTDIIETGDGYHIEGYPDAERLAELTTPLAKRLADLRMHQSTLKRCEAAMHKFGEMKSDSLDHATIMLTGIVASFFSCFGDNKASLSLAQNRVFAGREDAKAEFKFWKALRDKHMVHNEGGYDILITGVALGPDSAVQDIISFRFAAAMAADEGACQNLYELIVHTTTFVAGEIENLLPRVFDEAQNLRPSDRAALPDVKFNVPVPEDASKNRPRRA